MQLTLLITSPRVAPGLMTRSAWSALADAPVRLASSLGAPLSRAVAAAGLEVEVLDEVSGGRLLELARTRDVVWLADDEEAERLPTELAGALVDGPDPSGGEPTSSEVQVQVLHASYDVPGARLLDLVAVMDRLRTDCPWDREQTHTSLAPYLLEETYETLEAIESGDADHLREELGDLLLQVFFHARVAEEAGADGFDVDDVAAGIVEKLVHRHPHVFAGVEVEDADEVNRNWELLKAREKGRTSVLDGVPPALPALALADKVLGRAQRVGVHPAPGAPTGAAGLGGADVPDAAVAADALGERLLRLVVEARAAGLDAEQELRGAVRRLTGRVRLTESP